MNKGGLNGEISLARFLHYGATRVSVEMPIPRGRYGEGGEKWRGRGESLLARELKGMMGARVYPQLGCAPGTLDVGSASGVL